MVGIIESARLLWCPGLVNLTGKPNFGMQEWLAKAIYAPAVSSNSIMLTGIDKHNLLEALAYDINRSASAGSETLQNVVEIEIIPKSSAWHYVKIYYAALFYAHTVLRVWGRSPTYLWTSDLIGLRSSLVAYSITPPFKLNTGQFLFFADMQYPALKLRQDNGGGGTHEAIWREFNRALIALKDAVNTAPYVSTDKLSIDNDISLAMSILTKNGSNLSWPSMMRNEIQYRQGHGLWFPYNGKVKSASLQSDIQKIAAGKMDKDTILNSGGTELNKFWCACAFVIWFGRNMLADMTAIAGAKGFLRYGQARFERSMKTAA